MKKLTFTFFCGILACQFATSQDSKIDSLQQVLKASVSDTAKIIALNNLSWEYLNSRSNMPEAKIYIDSIFALSKEKNFLRGIALANYQYGTLERQKGNYEKALAHFDLYIDYAKQQGNRKRIADGSYQKALVYDNRGDFDKSSEIYYDILKIYQELGDTYSVALVQNALGDQLKENNKLSDAIENYTKALETFAAMDKKRDMAHAYYNLGEAYTQKEVYDQALDFYNKALEIDLQIGDLWGIAYDYESIGEVHQLNKNHEEALSVHLEALKIREQLGQKMGLTESHYHVGDDYLELKNYQKAKYHLETAVSIAENIDAKVVVEKAYKSLSDLYTATGDHKSASLIKDKYITVKDSLLNETKLKQIEELQIKFDTEKKQDDIVALQKDAEIKDLSLERQRAIRNLIIGLSAATLLLAYVLFNRYRRKQKEKETAEKKQRQIDEERQKTLIEKQRVEELQKIDRLKDEFLANTSHELRTPLNGIIGLSESLKDGAAGPLTSKAIENLDMIANSGKRLSHLVNDILDFSKLKNQDLTLILSPVDMHSVVNIILKLSEPLVKDKKLKLINSIPNTVSLVEADENRVQQILHNLIGNAIKFTEKGQIEITAEEKGNTITFSISDSGIGIPLEKLEDIFKSFEQKDGSTQREFGGTGLGLSVTKQLVELHGGSMNVVSEVGKGSTFSFTLSKSKIKRKDIYPATEPEPVLEKLSILQSDEEQKPTASLEGLTDVQILIVDDEPVNRQVLNNHLTNAGYGVTETGSGPEALSLFENGRVFDIVLLDVMMPGMSGYEVCELLRKQFMVSELPIILLTARNRVSDLVAGFNVGANDYLTKPFSKNELLSRIKTHLNLNGIHKAANKFVPTEFIKSVGREDITDVVLGDNVEKNVTVLFTDIRQYTTLAEHMTPKENFKFVNAYVGKMGPVISNNKGFVNQYLGDGIMALFPHEAEHALQASIDMQKTVQQYNVKRKEEGHEPISVGMGLHTGQLIMGIIGDNERNDTAIIADTVNTASRMEGVTKHYGANIIISEESFKTIENQDDYHFRYLGKVQVKGKDNITRIYECFDGDEDEVVALKIKSIKDFEKGLEHFFNNEFPKASGAFDKVLTANPKDKVAKYFVTKSAEYTISGVPKDWEIVNTMSEK